MQVARSIDRRTVLKSAAGLAADALASPLIPRGAFAESTSPSPDLRAAIIQASSSVANVETSAGKIRGYIRNDIYTFKGVPYGASTAGSARFLAPSKPVPWTGVRTTMHYGPVAPQPKRENWNRDEMAFLLDWDDGYAGEDCLVLNIWTQSLSDSRKRPVMVWLHGGASTFGSGHQLKCYDGENLCRRGDAVVITLNHRLGIFGYLDLSRLGDDAFADSVNVGMLDIVQALQWVRENIANFGGDPGNVTIFGESSGGYEVSILMNMPRAQGLFHRAIVQSGSSLKLNTKDQAAQRTDRVLKGLGLNRSNFSKIQTLPVEQIIEVATKVGGALGARFWVDGQLIPTDPFDPSALKMSAQVPMLIGTVLNEASPIGDPGLEAEFADVEKHATATFGGKAPAIIETARRLHPKASPIEISTLIDLSVAGSLLYNAIKQAQLKSALGGAPAYMYLFAWQTPVLDGRLLALHQSEIPFVFDNTDGCASMTGGGPEPRALAAKVCDAWINFARHGNPSHPGLPDWPAFTKDNGATMVFDSACRLQSYPDRELHDLIVSVIRERTHS